MAFVKGDFGIEYNPARRDRTPLGFKLAVGTMIAAVLGSLLYTLVSRLGNDDGTANSPAAENSLPPAPGSADCQARLAYRARNAGDVLNGTTSPSKRPVAVRNLLLRLEEAEKSRDLVVIVSTIEQIRALPGRPAADIDGRLAKRLGDLNAQWLFDYANAQWVKKITVKAGDSAIRIARENGSTLSSLLRLNGIADAGRIKSGSIVKVMNHPRCNLVVSPKKADLHLNGKFFRRYEIEYPHSAKAGVYDVGNNPGAVLSALGVSVKNRKSREELESLLPRGATVTICDD